MRRSRLSRTGNDVGEPIAVYVADSDEHAALKAWVVCQELCEFRSVDAVDDLHNRRCARSGCDDDVRSAVGVHIAERDAGARSKCVAEWFHLVVSLIRGFVEHCIGRRGAGASGGHNRRLRYECSRSRERPSRRHREDCHAATDRETAREALGKIHHTPPKVKLSCLENGRKSSPTTITGGSSSAVVLAQPEAPESIAVARTSRECRR